MSRGSTVSSRRPDATRVHRGGVMELNDTLRVPLAPTVVRDALEDLALLRASFDHCESFVKLAHGEFALTITVPLGPLRARYDVRAHAAAEQGRRRRSAAPRAQLQGAGRRPRRAARPGRTRADAGWRRERHANRVRGLGDGERAARRTAGAADRQCAARMDRHVLPRVLRGRAGETRSRAESRERRRAAPPACISAAGIAGGRDEAFAAASSRRRAERTCRERAPASRFRHGARVGLGSDDRVRRAAAVRGALDQRRL
ncbi:hypothetical protein BCPG_02139, partial [Burkholderia cenocepacia PC184]